MARVRRSEKNRPRRYWAGQSDPIHIRDLVLFTAQRKLVEREGRASGLKFNKLVFHIHRTFMAHDDPDFHFTLPHRWYLFGAVVDTRELNGAIMIDREEDEPTSQVHWSTHRDQPPEDHRLTPEIERLCDAFIERFPGDSERTWMLEDHYQSAPLPFQRAFLSWNTMMDDMIHGTIEVSVRKIRSALEGLMNDYPDMMDERLTPSFHRLTLLIDHRLEHIDHITMEEVSIYRHLLWDFWSTFCLSMSEKHYENISPERLEGFRRRTGMEIPAYKRRLNNFLETEYLKMDPGEMDEDSMKVLANLLEIRFLRLPRD